MAKLKTNKIAKQEPPKKGKPSLIGRAIGVAKNPNKYYNEQKFEKYTPKNKSTRTFSVSDPNVYKNRAKRYNDSLSLYTKGESDRAKAKKNTIDAVNKYNKNKSFWEAEVEYAGESKLYGNTIRQEVRHKKSANAYSKLISSSAKSLRDGKGGYVNRDSDVYPRPEYKPVYTPKKTKVVSVSKPKMSSNKLTSSSPKVENTKTIKTPVSKSAVKVVAKDTVASKPITKPIVKDTIVSKPKASPAVSSKPSQKIPKIKSSNNYGDTGTVNRGSYIETKTKMAPKKGPSEFKTVKKNYK